MNFPLVSAGYKGRSNNIDSQLMINFYAELEQISGKKIVSALIGTPGTTLFASLGQGAVRGMHNHPNGLLYVVAGNQLYSINTAGFLSASLGTLLTGSGRVQMENNGLSPTGGNQIMIVDNPYAYIYNVATGVFTQIAGGGWPAAGASTVTMMDGYFIITIAGGSGQFQVSNLYDGLTWQALYAAGDNYTGQQLVAIKRNHSELWLFNYTSTEFWYDSGQGFPPFQRIQGGVLDHGLEAPLSVAEADNTLFWLAQNGNGNPYVVMANGHSVQRISTTPIEWQWQQYTTREDAFAFSYMDEGHQFYWITFPSGNATWVYDLSTGFWHQRSTYAGSGSQYAVNRHCANVHVFWNEMHLIGDYRNGNIYQMTSSAYDDNGQPIVSIRTCPVISDEQKWTFANKLQIDGEMGVGTIAEQNPQIVVDWSDDGGATYGNQHNLPMGAMGKTGTRAVIRRMGKFRQRTYRVAISNAVKKVLTDAYFEARTGVN